jgi:uncharacterized membrane protein YqiK
MQREVPIWLAVVIVLAVIAVAIALYWWQGRWQPTEPPPHALQHQVMPRR